MLRALPTCLRVWMCNRVYIRMCNILYTYMYIYICKYKALFLTFPLPFHIQVSRASNLCMGPRLKWTVLQQKFVRQSALRELISFLKDMFMKMGNFSIWYNHTCMPTCFRGLANVFEMETSAFRSKTWQSECARVDGCVRKQICIHIHNVYICTYICMHVFICMFVFICM